MPGIKLTKESERFVFIGYIVKNI